VVDYNLDRLGDRAFEQMVVSLAHHYIGTGVQAFGDGPDGGREATYTGPIDWSATVPGDAERWDGTCVFQAKFKNRPSDHAYVNAAWLQTAMRKEFEAWLKPDSKRGPLPDYIVFATNVVLSPAAGGGGIDKIDEFMRAQLAKEKGIGAKGVKGWRVWHFDQICTMLDGAQDIRLAYPGLLTVGDALARIGDHTSGIAGGALQSVMQSHVRKSLLTDRWIRFDESGGPAGQRMSIDKLVIDLPAWLDEIEPDVMAIRYIVDHGDQVLRPSQVSHDGVRPHIVLMGGPGQGKSTLSRLLAQVYRVSVLDDAELAGDAATVAAATRATLDRLQLQMPRNRRWPMRIDLAEYADALGAGGGQSILRWLAASVSKRVTENVTPGMLKSWLRAWPWALILDGLDEVTSPQTRDELINMIGDFEDEAAEVDADMMMVITTRPMGYDNQFNQFRFVHLTMKPLSASAARAFASRVTDVRLADDPERHEQVARRMAEAAADPAKSHLLQTPLQVMVMSFILERFANLPPDRYRLFGRYYDAIYDREAAKATPLARLLNLHRSDIDYLHERIGLELHVMSETAGDAVATLPTEDMLRIAADRLRAIGHDDPVVSATAKELVRAATQRLVLLVPRNDEIGFEVRTLQELMAAKAIVSGTDEQLLGRLRLTAHSPHWRNAWLLAAGRIFAEKGDHLRDALVQTLATLDTDPRRLGRLFPSAPELAVDILADGLAAQAPKWRRQILQTALGVVDGLPPRRNQAQYLARTLIAAAEEDESQRRFINVRLETACQGNALQRVCTGRLLEAILDVTNGVGTQAAKAKLLQNTYFDTLLSAHASEGTQLLDLLADVDSFGLDDDSARLIESAIRALHRDTMPITPEPMPQASRQKSPYVYPGELLDALDDDDAAVALELMLQTIGPDRWPLLAAIDLAVRPMITRIAVGRQLLDSFEDRTD
jgi:adenylate kinase family enzyme